MTNSDVQNAFETQQFPESDRSYQDWRDRKLTQNDTHRSVWEPVEICDLANPTVAERAELYRRCEASSFASYTSSHGSNDENEVREQLVKFTNLMGLRIAERHRSAGKDGIVALQVSNKESQKGYIPYTTKPINWHTEGYYNSPDQKIRAMILHCVRPAKEGGVNQLLDPEIAYIRLRDENPAFITALMHPKAMLIPENLEPDGKLRPTSVGPVFSVDSATGKLEMRYTARTRSIAWRSDPMTRQAVAFLESVLASDDEFIQTGRLDAGVGVICNNSLHNRTGFDANETTPSSRLLLRIRFHNRVQGG